MKKLSVDDLTAQLEKDKGNIAATARKFGVMRSTVYARISDSPVLQKVLTDARESMLDNAESVLYKKVLEGSTPELIFFLKTQGRNRGYVERQELTGKDGGAIEVAVTKGYVSVSPDDWHDDQS